MKLTQLAFRILFLGCFVILLIPKGIYAKKNSSVKPAFDKGSNTIGLFVGGGVSYGYYGNVTETPALGVLFDHGLLSEIGPGTIGIGGVIAFKSSNYLYNSGNYKATWTNIVVGVRGTYHLTLLKEKNNKFDPYAGVTAGLRILRYKDTYYSAVGVSPYDYPGAYPVIGGFVGAKYNFAKHFGAFAELGYDISYARIGLNLNF